MLLLLYQGHSLDTEKLLKGDQTVVYFGSAMTNFGVQIFLDDFLELGRAPAERSSSIGTIDPGRDEFSGFVFKLQANMDPRHRDRLAFIRIVSGRYERGMKVIIGSPRHLRGLRYGRQAGPGEGGGCLPGGVKRGVNLT